MVVVDFQQSPSSIAEYRREIPHKKRVDIITDWYWFPVQFSVGHVVLFEVSQPIIYIAQAGLASVVNAARFGESDLHLWYGSKHLHFSCRDGNLTVRSDLTGMAATASYEDVERAWRSFGQRVGEFLYREFPELRTHPLWGPQMGAWFPTGMPQTSTQEASRSRKTRRRGR
jgi:hypothetical protein